MKKPWWKSLTVKGVIVGTVGLLLSPEVTTVLATLPPEKAEALSDVVKWAGLAAAILGVRRAAAASVPPDQLPGILPGVPSDPQDWHMTFDSRGVNPYGETLDDVKHRLETMAKLAREREQELLGRHRTTDPKPPGY